MRVRSSLVCIVLGIACRTERGSQSPPSSAASEPVAAEPVAAEPVAPTQAIVKTHAIAMTVPAGWTVTSGEDWAIARDPAGTAGFLLYGWDDAARSPEHLHRAEAEFAATMPIGLGKIATFASGLRMSMTLGDAVRQDGVAVKTLMMAGGSPSGKGGIGAFAFWRADATQAQLAVLQAALDSVAPIAR